MTALFDALSNACQKWLESQGYLAAEADEIVQQLRSEARFNVEFVPGCDTEGS